MRGMPRLPSSDSISADSSPTSYAPAPVCVMMSKSTPLGAEDVLAQKALRVGVGDGLLHDFEQVAILAAQVDEAGLRADGQAGDHRAFNHRMRIVQKDQVILAGSRLALVAVHQHVLRLGRLLGHERPLHAGREARAAAPAQAAGLHLVDDPLRPLREALLHGLVAAQLDVAVDVGRALPKRR
jgi:hypothetical protein